MAAFMKKHATTPRAPAGRFPPGTTVTLDGITGVVAFTDGDRVVWCDDSGVIHLTLTKYLWSES